MTAVITVNDLVKTYGSVRALNGLNLQVDQGSVHGFLGPNGAGKTTALRILMGSARADSGEHTIFGLDTWHDTTAVHARVAYVPSDVTLWPNLTGGEVIDLLARLHGQADPARRTASRAASQPAPTGQSRDELIERFQLNPTARVRTYSRGNRQKVALIAGLALPADLLMVDEPTSGLDPIMESVFAECIRERAAHGTTVLMSSHTLSEVEALCDHVTIIAAGAVVETGALAELKHLRGVNIRAQVASPIPELSTMHGVTAAHTDGHDITCTVTPASLDAVMRLLAGAGLVNLQVASPTLEELFLRHYRTTPTR